VSPNQELAAYVARAISLVPEGELVEEVRASQEVRTCPPSKPMVGMMDVYISTCLEKPERLGGGWFHVRRDYQMLTDRLELVNENRVVLR
jgi:hypothetical protein